MVFINGVNLGRYWTMGPQRTLYVPAPILNTGLNRVWSGVRERCVPIGGGEGVMCAYWWG